MTDKNIDLQKWKISYLNMALKGAENEIKQLKEKLSQYKEVLEFYADLDPEIRVYESFLIERPDVYHAPMIDQDRGEMARSVLLQQR